MKKFVQYAVKAPSGHNSQPWKFKIEKNRIEIHPNFENSLPVVDPQNRELYISLGCAAENICAAAPAFGYKTEWDIIKTKERSVFICIYFMKSACKPSENIIKTIEQRQTNRSKFNGNKITTDVLENMGSIQSENNIAAYYFPNGDKNFLKLKEYISRGNELQMNDSAFKNELLSWIRFNKKHTQKTNSGLTYKVMSSPPLPEFIGNLIVRSFLNPKAQNKTDAAKIDSSSHLILLTSKNNTEEEWIRLGIYLERQLLKLTELGIASAYLNPPCEIEALSDELRETLPINGEYPAIIMRIGYARKVAFSPRKDPEAVICL